MLLLLHLPQNVVFQGHNNTTTKMWLPRTATAPIVVHPAATASSAATSTSPASTLSFEPIVVVVAFFLRPAHLPVVSVRKLHVKQSSASAAGPPATPLARLGT